MTQGRSLYKQIFQNFINSLKPRKLWGELKGIDHRGTEYYELAENMQGKKLARRWFIPKTTDNFEQEIPTEWEAWLRHRRKDPPTEEEIKLNYQKMMQVIENSKKLEEKSVKKPTMEIKNTENIKFPKHEEYDLDPVKSVERKNS